MPYYKPQNTKKEKPIKATNDYRKQEKSVLSLLNCIQFVSEKEVSCNFSAKE